MTIYNRCRKGKLRLVVIDGVHFIDTDSEKQNQDKQ